MVGGRWRCGADEVVKNAHYDEALDLSSSTILTQKTMAGEGEGKGDDREAVQNDQ